jgi:hypothetical protein
VVGVGRVLRLLRSITDDADEVTQVARLERPLAADPDLPGRHILRFGQIAPYFRPFCPTKSQYNFPGAGGAGGAGRLRPGLGARCAR